MCSLHVLFIRRLWSTNYQSYLLKILRFDFKRNIILIYHQRVDIFPYLYTKARRYECSLKLAINTQSSYLFSFFFYLFFFQTYSYYKTFFKKLYIFLNFIMHSFFTYWEHVSIINSDEIVNILLSNNKKSTNFFFNNGGIYSVYEVLFTYLLVTHFGSRYLFRKQSSFVCIDYVIQKQKALTQYFGI